VGYSFVKDIMDLS